MNVIAAAVHINKACVFGTRCVSCFILAPISVCRSDSQLLLEWRDDPCKEARHWKLLASFGGPAI
jgi:hypothetical protein